VPHASWFFHGVPLIDHHDGVASVIMSAHDMSALRRSEEILEDSNSPAAPSALETERAEPQQERLEQLEGLLRDGRIHLLDLRTKLERESIEARSLAAVLAEREASLKESIAAHAALTEAFSVKERENADLAAALAEHQRVAVEDARDRDEKERRAREEISTLTAERDRLAELLSTERAQQLETLQTTRERATAERDDLQAQLKAAASERRELAARLEEATNARQRAEDALATARLEIQALDAGTEQLLPLVSAGRLALEISEELTGVIAAIDARAASLSAVQRDPSASRDAQALRTDVVLASLLSREILLSCNRGKTVPEPGRSADDTVA
jgi:chromosome segregation ATPase